AGQSVGRDVKTVGPGTLAPNLTLADNEVEEDLQGRGADQDGERTDYFCSDGYDNDGDGFTDCDDIGCKLGTEVTVCQAAGDIRFSVVVRIAQDLHFAGPEFGDKALIKQPRSVDPNAVGPRGAENRSPFST